MSSFTQGLSSFSSSWMHFFWGEGGCRWGLALLRMWEGDSFHCAIVTLPMLARFPLWLSISGIGFFTGIHSQQTTLPQPSSALSQKTSTFSLDFVFTVPGLASTPGFPTSQIHNRWLSQRSLFLIVWLGLIWGYVLVQYTGWWHVPGLKGSSCLHLTDSGTMRKPGPRVSTIMSGLFCFQLPFLEHLLLSDHKNALV